MIAGDTVGGALAVYALLRCFGGVVVIVALGVLVEWANTQIQKG